METNSLYTSINNPYLWILFKEMVYKIYGLYDKHNLRYIGYTSKSLQERLLAHQHSAFQTVRQCHRISWLKYMLINKKSIIIRLLDTAHTLEEVLLKEVEWIAEYRTNGADLVNTCKGGIGSTGHEWSEEDYLKRSKKVKQYDLKGNLILIHRSLSDASLAVSGTRDYNGKISGCCKGRRGRRTFYGFVFRYIDDSFDKHPVEAQINITYAQRKSLSIRQSTNNVMKNRTGILHPNHSSVEMLNDNGEVIASFLTIKDATQQTGACNISLAARKGGKRGGFYWRYKVKI